MAQRIYLQQGESISLLGCDLGSGLKDFRPKHDRLYFDALVYP